VPLTFDEAERFQLGVRIAQELDYAKRLLAAGRVAEAMQATMQARMLLDRLQALEAKDDSS